MTTFAFGWILLSLMRRKFLAVLLIGSWVLLSGFDLLEDLDSQTQFGLYSANSCNGSLLDSGPNGNLTNNIVESADRTELSEASLFELLGVQFPVESSLSSKRASRLYKVHRVFLI